MKSADTNYTVTDKEGSPVELRRLGEGSGFAVTLGGELIKWDSAPFSVGVKPGSQDSENEV